jgi:hypothetical protein
MTGTVSLRVASPLGALLPSEDGASARSRPVLLLDAGSWADVVTQLHDRAPLLAERVLTASGDVVGGLVLVVDDEVVQRPSPSLPIAPGAELCLLAALAGG